MNESGMAAARWEGLASSAISKLGHSAQLMVVTSTARTCAQDRCSCSPDLHPHFRRPPHGLIGLHAEGFVEFRNVGERAEHAPFRRGMDVAQQIAPQPGFLFLMQPAKRVAEEVALERSQS